MCIIFATDNFSLKFTGSQSQYHIHSYSDPSRKLQAPESADLHQSTIPTGSEGSTWFVESGADSQSGVRLYTTSGSKKWYLRADRFTSAATVVREDHLNDVSISNWPNGFIIIVLSLELVVVLQCMIMHNIIMQVHYSSVSTTVKLWSPRLQVQSHPCEYK